MSTETTEVPENTSTEQDEQQDQARMSAFAEGYDDDTNPTATQPPEGGGAEPEGETAAAPAPAPEYVQLTRAELEELKARAALIDQMKATQDKGFGTMGNTIRGIKEQMDALGKGKRIEIDQKEIDDLRSDGFETHAKALEKLRDLQVVSTGADPETIQRIADERAEARLATFKQELEARSLRRVHPDWEQYQTAPEFEAWVKAQPEDYRGRLLKASQAWDSDFIAEAMTKAKDAAKKAAASTQRKPQVQHRETVLEAAIQPRGTGSARPSQDRTNAFREGFDQEG